MISRRDSTWKFKQQRSWLLIWSFSFIGCNWQNSKTVSDLNNWNVFLPVLDWGARQGWFLSEGCKGELLYASLQAFGGLLEIFSFPWLVDVLPCSLCWGSDGILPLCLCVLRCPLFVETSVILEYAPLLQKHIFLTNYIDSGPVSKCHILRHLNINILGACNLAYGMQHVHVRAHGDHLFCCIDSLEVE